MSQSNFFDRYRNPKFTGAEEGGRTHGSSRQLHLSLAPEFPKE